MATYFRRVSDHLFDGGSDEAAVMALTKMRPAKRPKSNLGAGDVAAMKRWRYAVKVTRFHEARAGDKRHDWATVK